MTLPSQEPQEPELPLSKRLKAATRATHERLDKMIMLAKPFDSLQNYERFLHMQFVLHKDVAPLYVLPGVARHIDKASALPRLSHVHLDLEDLNLQPPAEPRETAIPDTVSFAEALGWLYVVEGSKLGAAFLLKAVAGLDLNEHHGARHLAAAPEGRGAHWRYFTDRLDDAGLSAPETEDACRGARDAFRRASQLATHYLGASATTATA